jgi:glutamate-1-semialdehyde 2,1-aminomutase
MSCVYDFKTKVTSAFLVGEFIASTTRCNEEPRLCLGIAHEIVNYLEAYTEYWSHSLLLPSLITVVHLTRISTYCSRSLTNNVMRLEDELSVTRVGRRNSLENLHDGKTFERHRDEDDPIISKGLLAKEEAMRLTIRINTQSTRLLVAKVSPSWTKSTCEALLECLASPIICPDFSAIANLEQRLKANIRRASYLETHLDSLQARLMLQLNVLYSFIAQTDNRYSARLAELSGRDSTSMKILAFITTIFLPGTFVATMFSMDMFTWQPDEMSGRKSISGQFWIYWW